MKALFAVFGRGILFGALAVGGSGCGADRDPGPSPQGEAGKGPADWSLDAGQRHEPPFEAFAIALDQSVTVGAFVLHLASARVAPGEVVFGPYAQVDLDFRAHNVSTQVASPLADLDSDGRILEAGGRYFFGEVDAAPVPGLRDGVGSLSWVIADELSAEDLRGATLTLGRADQNAAVVPFLDASAAITLSDIPLDAQFAIKGYRNTTLEVTAARVQYNSRNANLPLPAGTAWLVLEGVLSADPDMSRYGEYWGEENVFLERPDGVSVAPDRLNYAIYPGDREDLQLIFELIEPVTGLYTFGVTDRSAPTVTHPIEVP